MKAKEWAKKLDDCNTEEKFVSTLKEMTNEFFSDIKKLKEARGVKTISGASSIILELDQKWKSVARKTKVNKIKETGFLDILKKAAPMEFSQLII